MKCVDKALTAVLRSGADDPQVLVFRHPTTGLQLPKGTVEPMEDMQSAARRELLEESGLALDTPLDLIGTWDRIVGGGPHENGPLEINSWHIFSTWADEPLPDQWDHEAKGSPAETGLVFSFSWLPLNDGFPARLDPIFENAARMILRHARG